MYKSEVWIEGEAILGWSEKLTDEKRLGTGGRETDKCKDGGENVCGGTGGSKAGWKVYTTRSERKAEAVSVKERMFGQNVDFVLETLGSH